jgi:outer membrane cobalamin receptor
MYCSGKRYAYDQRTGINDDFTSIGNIQTLDAIVDINLGVDYQIKDNLSIFLKVTNLLNYNYDLYYQYPSQGINVMAGIRYKF